jgi:PleD family two-component response regulator
VRDLRIPHAASLTRPYVTASVGAATLAPGSDYSHDLAVQMADRALYTAKADGRDGWSYFDPGLAHPARPDQLLKTAS